MSSFDNGDRRNNDDGLDITPKTLFPRCQLCKKVFVSFAALLSHMKTRCEFRIILINFGQDSPRDDAIASANPDDDDPDSVIPDAASAAGDDAGSDGDDGGNNTVGADDGPGDGGDGPVTLDLLREWTPFHASAPREAPVPPEPMEEDESGLDLELKLWFD